ncbi:MAG: hypothetical protein QM656_15970 [Paracoccaceae bacterium]
MGSLKRFLRDEAGSVTVDWVVLTAALVGVGAAMASSGVFDIKGALLGEAGSVSSAIVGARDSGASALQD